MRPSLRLSVPAPVVDVGEEEYFLDGEARDGGGLASVTVNGEDMGLAARGAVQQRFARRLPLEDGTNRFTVAATDLAGNKSTKSFTVVRRAPEYLDDELRLTLGITPVAADDPATLGPTVRRILENEILRRPARFHVLERDEGWDFILREQQLSLSDLADSKAALRIGKMLPAEMLMMSSLIKESSGVTIYTRIVETGNGEVLLDEDVYSAAPDKDIDFAARGLVMKVRQGFPLVEGRVYDLAGERALIDVGQKHGVMNGMRFVVVESAGDPAAIANGRVRRVGDAPVQLQVRRAGTDSGAADVIPSDAAALVKKGDFVVAR
jgi:hypothetical protein